ncbi:hypothetical protein C8F04DRAFT_1187862 [Mycena alexandri]|uniref:Uncharacterized protein n=1 Tax=Mycena alexandri TaxID=1745969 RepID=A0AAD6SJN8_9AGAR|nr:hypothetical protein C8F04DRAFT_1187862 [Mycena alexandri]
MFSSRARHQLGYKKKQGFLRTRGTKHEISTHRRAPPQIKFPEPPMGKKASIRRPKKRSVAQKAQSSALGKGNKENLMPPPPKKSPTARKPKDYKAAYSSAQRKVGRMTAKEATLQGKISDLKTQLKVQQIERDKDVHKLEIAAKKATDLLAERERRLLVVHEKLVGSQKITLDVQQQNRALAKRVHRASGVLQRAIARTKARPHTSRLTRQAIYSVHARQMAREMVAAGCAPGKRGFSG